MKYLQDKNYNVISLDDFYKFKEEKNFPDDAAALEIEKEMAALDIKEFEKVGQRAIAYAFGSIPARYAMERKDQERAITLKPMDPQHIPWIDADKRDIINTHFSRVRGFFKLGRPDAADADVAIMSEMI